MYSERGLEGVVICLRVKKKTKESASNDSGSGGKKFMFDFDVPKMDTYVNRFLSCLHFSKLRTHPLWDTQILLHSISLPNSRRRTSFRR